MRKLIAILAVLALGVSANAGLQISGTDNADGTGTIAWEGTEGDTVVGMALKISTEDTIDSVVMGGFNVFIDQAHTAGTLVDDNADNLPDNAQSNPVANAAQAGEIEDPTNLTGDFVVCGGYLAADNPGLASGTITLNAAAGATVTVAPDALRGGVVALGGAALDFTAFDFTITAGSTDPECWGYTHFDKGDANGDNIINGQDFNVMLPAFNKNAGEEGYDPCADFNKDGVINGQDFNMLLPYFNQDFNSVE